MPENYPLPAFHFQVQFANAPFDVDNRFLEVSGLTQQWQVEEIREGGQNLYAHKVPTVPTHENLVLRRGLMTSTSALTIWCQATLAGNLALPILAVPVVVNLLGADGSPAATWTLFDAWPVKWSVSKFNAQESSLAVETLEFSYSTMLTL